MNLFTAGSAGSFPRVYIAKDETVIFETRPSKAAFLKIGRLIGVIIGAIIFSLIQSSASLAELRS